MRAYVIVDSQINDIDSYRAYLPMAQKAVEHFGGRYLVRGGQMEVMEGEWLPTRLVLLEFPNMDAARSWYHSREYKEAKKLSRKAFSRNLVIVEGA